MPWLIQSDPAMGCNGLLLHGYDGLHYRPHHAEQQLGSCTTFVASSTRTIFLDDDGVALAEIELTWTTWTTEWNFNLHHLTATSATDFRWTSPTGSTLLFLITEPMTPREELHYHVPLEAIRSLALFLNQTLVNFLSSSTSWFIGQHPRWSNRWLRSSLSLASLALLTGAGLA